MRLIFTFIIALSLTISAKAQNDIYQNRLGFKFGYRHYFGMDYEYYFKTSHYFSLYTDINYLKVNNAFLHFEYFNPNIGARFYLIKRLKGLFVGTSLGYFIYNGKSEECTFFSDLYEIPYSHGIINYKSRVLLIHPNIGYRFFFKHFTFSAEIGSRIERLLYISIKEYAEGFTYDDQVYPDYYSERSLDDMNSKFMINWFNYAFSIGIAF